MALLIDGYNLLHASGILPRGIGPGTLERSRHAMLNFLAESLEPAELAVTTVVFDAAAAPPGLPRVTQFRGLTVRFASDHADADELLEELIQAESSPRRLIVVSSDHRLQRAARRRKAQPVDSDRWYAEICRRRFQGPAQGPPSADKPTGPPTEAEVQYWLRMFGETPAEGEASPAAHEVPPAAPDKRLDAPSSSDMPRNDWPNPFPPGYGEDITEDDV